MPASNDEETVDTLTLRDILLNNSQSWKNICHECQRKTGELEGIKRD